MRIYAVAPEIVARNPLFEQQSERFFNSLVTAYGADEAGLVWVAACIAYDQLGLAEEVEP